MDSPVSSDKFSTFAARTGNPVDISNTNVINNVKHFFNFLMSFSPLIILQL